MNRKPLDRFEWERELRGADIPLSTRGVALTLAGYANKDGSNAHPGERRLAGDCLISERQLRRHLRELEKYGWITNVSPVDVTQYRRRGFANIYHLTIPPDHRTSASGDEGSGEPSPEPSDHRTSMTDHRTSRADHRTPTTDHRTSMAGTPDMDVPPPSTTTPVNQASADQAFDHSAPLAPRPSRHANELTDDEILNALYGLYEADPEAYKALKKRAEQIHGLDRRQYVNEHDANVVNREMYRLWATAGEQP